MAEAAEGTRQQAKADRPEPPNPLPALDGTAPGGHKCAARLAEIRCRLLEDVGALDSVLASLPGGGSAPSHLVQLERRWPPSPPPSARRRPSPRAARVGAAHAAQGGLSPAAGGAHSCDGGPLATQISTGAECVKPTEQPAQPSDESADLPPQPVVSRTSGSRVSESRSAGSKTVSSRFSEKVFAAAAVERGEKDRSSPGSPVSVKPPGVDARRRSGASEPRGKRAEGVFSDHKESMGSSFELFFGLVIGSNALMSGFSGDVR
ncbi:unnamed protein product [Prorocentrum cordatum]|uniref:Uncharacterized protein n=1 Tax=Prorocentrum cordatum TaxID=2364126 RepID=A0ABN9RST5_9DINO|nr:unnamed protein product [Polarella glacialis]